MPEKKPSKYGVFQRKNGSHTLGEARFEPLKAVPVTDEVIKTACPDSTPVKFFDTEDAANANIKALKEKFDKQPKAQPEN